MASFRKRNSTWQYRIVVKDPFTQKNREYTESGYKTKKEAQLAAAQRENDIANGVEQGNIMFVFFARKWLENYIKNKRKPNTYKSYRNAIEIHAIPYFGNIDLKSIKPMMYQKFIDDKIESGLSPVTARRIHNTINQLMKRAVINNYLIKNPCENVVIERKKVKKLKYLDPPLLPEILAFIYQRGYTYGMFFETLYESGMRKGECAALKLDDIDWKKGVLRVDNSLDFQPEEGDDILGDTKTYRSNRNIKMRPGYMQKLKTYIKYQSERKLHLGSLYKGELNLLFAREDGSPLPKSTLYNVFKAGMEHIGVTPLPIHSTRHTHSVILLEAGWSMKAIQERLGHESMETTSDIYSHISENFEQKSMEQFDDFMKSREK